VPFNTNESIRNYDRRFFFKKDEMYEKMRCMNIYFTKFILLVILYASPGKTCTARKIEKSRNVKQSKKKIYIYIFIYIIHIMYVRRSMSMFIILTGEKYNLNCSLNYIKIIFVVSIFCCKATECDLILHNKIKRVTQKIFIAS